MVKHPGEILMEQVLVPNGTSIRHAAGQLGMSAETLGLVIAGTQPVTPALAHGLAREFAFSAAWWLRLQRAWDEEQLLAA